MFPSNSPNLIKNALSLDIIAGTERLYQIHKAEKITFSFEDAGVVKIWILIVNAIVSSESEQNQMFKTVYYLPMKIN